MKKGGIIILIIIAVIVLGVAIGIISEGLESKETINLKNNVDNTSKFNEIVNGEETEFANEQIVNGESNVIANEVSSSETFEEEPKTEQEKAINIAKADWNGNANSQNVKFTVDGMDQSGKYIVSVRDRDTTEALAFYTVNVNDKTFTKREMN